MNMNIFLFIGFFSFCASAHSESIISNKQVDSCIKKYKEENSECLGEISDQSNKKLKDAYDSKLNELERFDFSNWWMGTKEQKDNAIRLFKVNQKNWIAYRDDYCGLAATATQGTQGFANAISACSINLNNQRIKEIKMILFDPNDE